MGQSWHARRFYFLKGEGVTIKSFLFDTLSKRYQEIPEYLKFWGMAFQSRRAQGTPPLPVCVHGAKCILFCVFNFYLYFFFLTWSYENEVNFQFVFSYLRLLFFHYITLDFGSFFVNEDTFFIIFFLLLYKEKKPFTRCGFGN